MIFTGTLDELTTMTRPFWKAKWWPKHIITPFDPCLYPSVAAEIIFARAVEWLMVKGAARNQSLAIYTAMNGRQFWINAGHKTSCSDDFRPSLLAAVLLMIGQIKENGGNGVISVDWSDIVDAELKAVEAPSKPT